MSDYDRTRARLIDVELDESIGRSTPDVEHERAVAIFDLIEENSFQPVNDSGAGPYRLKLSLAEQRLVFAVAREDGAAVVTHILSLTPLRRIVKDYYMICESYYDAIRSSTPSHIEAIDMGRRAPRRARSVRRRGAGRRGPVAGRAPAQSDGRSGRRLFRSDRHPGAG